MSSLPSVGLEVIIDESLVTLMGKDITFSPSQNKSLLSISNDYEDGKWRQSKFLEFIWNNVAETALTKRERDSLSSQQYTLLSDAAKKLRLTDAADKGRGSEIAEVLLYGIMKHHYNALPVVPKIFYKQNINDPVKGADSVHIVLEGDRDFSIWFGEAKFYNDITDAQLNKLVDSVADTLSTEKLKKENSIISNVRDIYDLVQDSKLRDNILEALSPRHTIDALKPKLHIPILLLHECSLTQAASTLSNEHKKEIADYHINKCKNYFEKQVKALSTTVSFYSDIRFHLVLFPCHNKQAIVNAFLETASNLRS